MIAGKQRDGDFQWARSAHAALPERGNAALPLYRFVRSLSRGLAAMRRQSNIGKGHGRLPQAARNFRLLA